MKFRPENDNRGETPTDWEDNFLSNFLAYGSYKVFPSWCQTEGHWSSRFSVYLWTDCPCCMLFRGLVIGFVLGTYFSLIISFVILLILATVS